MSREQAVDNNDSKEGKQEDRSEPLAQVNISQKTPDFKDQWQPLEFALNSGDLSALERSY